MGQVHMARHRSGHLVAIKTVRKTFAKDRLVHEQLTNEGRLLRRVQHPNVVRAIESGHDATGAPYLVMDQAHGTALDVVIAKTGPLGFERIASICHQLLAGLAAIHAAGVVHADVKSNNVMIDDEGHVVIIDFGLARTMSRTNVGGMIAGTPSFIAPEVISGEAPSFAADLYGVGAIVYEMLTGDLPFTGEMSHVLARQLTGELVAPSVRAPHLRISPEIDDVVLRALARDPRKRPANAQELADALEQALRGTSRELSEAELIELTTTRDFWGGETTAVPPRAVDPVLQSAPTRLIINADAIIDTALERVRQLLEKRDLDSSIRELEGALASLRSPEEERELPPVVWRIESVLAALYDRCGRSEAAARVSRLAYQHANRTGSEAAKLRTREILERIATRPRARMARGSRPISFETPGAKLRDKPWK